MRVRPLPGALPWVLLLPQLSVLSLTLLPAMRVTLRAEAQFPNFTSPISACSQARRLRSSQRAGRSFSKAKEGLSFKST